MKRTLATLCWAVVGLSIIFSSGCAAPGENKGAHQVIGEGVANTGLILYDIGAMGINTTWGVVSFGYGFVDGQTLLPLYQPDTGKFAPQKF
jgi:hypothetical protein